MHLVATQTRGDTQPDFMPYLQVEGTQFPLLQGETRVGRGHRADVRLPLPPGADEGVAASKEEDAIDAIITVGTSYSSTVRRASEGARIEVNGVALGLEPHPLSHGDRLSIGGLDAVFGDEQHSGNTGQHRTIEEDANSAGPADGVRAARTGGRLVSLTDGREYTVHDGGLTIGREAGCDVVILATQVSRRHARIELNANGYAVVDTSTNGVWVNGARLQGTRPLARGDTIKVGPEEFRFHADAAAPAEPHSPPVILATPPTPRRADPSLEAKQAPPAAASPPPAALPDRPPDRPPGSWSRSDEMPAATRKPPSPQPAAKPPVAPKSPASPAAAEPPGAPPPPPVVSAGAAQRRAALATLEIINEGPSKGTRFSITTVLAHVGRGAHNDVVINDESVSDTHAKLQRRGMEWVLVDMDSTNGSYVAGKRVQGEAPLSGSTDIRFGGVKLAFTSMAPAQKEKGETRVVVGYRGPTPRMTDAIADEGDKPAPDPASASQFPRTIVTVLLLLAIIVVYLIVRTL